MTHNGKANFKMMSFVHETLYGLFRDPYKVLHAAGLRAGQRVLEVGCGPGFFTIPAGRIVGDSGGVVAIDVNPLAVEKVQEKVDESGASNVEVRLGNAGQIGLPDGAFDLAFLFGLARPIGDTDAIWTELYRVLKPGGAASVEGRLVPPADLFELVTREGRIARFSKVG